MVVIESCENDVATGNGISVPDELPREVSSAGTVNESGAQHPERIETKECLVQRRVSPRLQNLPAHKKVYYGSGRKRSRSGNGNSSVRKKTKLSLSPSGQQQALVEEGESYPSETCVAGGDDTALNSTSNGCFCSLFDELNISTILRLKETLRLFNLYSLQFVQVEQNRSKKVDTNNLGAANFSRTKNGNASDVDNKRSRKQPDPKAISKASVGVGHQYFSRAEMAALGFHPPWLNGIDYMGKSYGKLIDKYWAEKGIAGFTLYNCHLKRLPRQAKLEADKVHFARGQLPKVPSGYTGLVSKDVSNGQEDISIPVTNECDDPPVAPAGFTYIRSIQIANNVTVPSSVHGCQCKGNCTNTRTCSCARLNGSEFPYVRPNGGRLIEPRDVVFECGPRCGCGPDCGNRISQKGLKYRLEVYRTPNKGWAVRSWDFVPSGAPVCEYVGVLRRNDELDNVAENDYIFDIDCLQTMNGVEGRERRLRDVSLPTSTSVGERDDETVEGGPEFCIDAGSFGNVARFINHSCEPNLFVQCVLSTYLDIRLARVVLFAADDIAPYQELTYDYGYKLDSVIGPDGQIKQLPCHCGAADCRKRLY